MRRRRTTGGRGPSLVGTAARTAVVAGTARAVTKGPAARGQVATTDEVGAMITRLKELAELRDAGILTEDEFAAQKAKLLN
jgi:Short C-terminal domain